MKRLFLLFLCFISLNLFALVDPQDGENVWCIIKRIGTTLDIIEPKLCDVQETVNDGIVVLCSKIEALETELDQDLDLVCSKLGVIETNLDVLTDSSLDGIADTLVGIDSLCDKALTTISEIDMLSDDVCDKLSQLDNMVSLAKDEILDGQDTLEFTLCSKLEKIEDDIADVDSDVATGFTTTNTNIDNTRDVLCSKIEALDIEIDFDQEVICSKLEKIEADIADVDGDVATGFTNTNTNIDNTRDVLCSKIEALDIEIDNDQIVLCSKIEILENKLCSIIDGSVIEVASTDSSFISSFGEKLVGLTSDVLSVQFQYGVSDLQVTSATTGSGSIIELNSMATVSTGATGVSSAQIQTNRRLLCRAGHEGYVFFTAAFVNGSAADSTQWIGLFDDDNGIAVGYNNTTFSILFRRDGVDSTVAQASFNRDTIDGMGSSGFDIDPTMLNMFRLSYGWLGATVLKFQVMDEGGCWITFHVIERPNNFDVPSFLNPTLPITSQINKTAGATDLRISSAGWNAGIIGFKGGASNRYFAKSGIVTVLSTTEVHVATFRNKSIYQSLPNVIEIRLVAFGGGSIGNNIEATIIRLKKEATVIGLSYSDVDTVNSVMELSTAGTYTASTGIEVVNRPVHNRANGPNVQLLPQSDISIFLFPGESITLTAESFSGNMNDILGTLWWEERH